MFPPPSLPSHPPLPSRARPLQAGADIGVCNKDGLTALDVAASRSNLLVECYLVAEGAFSSGEFWSAADSGSANEGGMSSERAKKHMVYVCFV